MGVRGLNKSGKKLNLPKGRKKKGSSSTAREEGEGEVIRGNYARK